jgi:hypothetical protein
MAYPSIAVTAANCCLRQQEVTPFSISTRPGTDPDVESVEAPPCFTVADVESVEAPPCFTVAGVEGVEGVANPGWCDL